MNSNITIVPYSKVIKYNKVPGIDGYYIIYCIKLNNVHLEGNREHGFTGSVKILKHDLVLLAKKILEHLGKKSKNVTIFSVETMQQYYDIELNSNIKIDQGLVPHGLKRKEPIYMGHMQEDNIVCGMFHITVLEFAIMREENDNYICKLSNIIIHSNSKMLQFQDDGIRTFKEWEQKKLNSSNVNS